MTLEELKQQHEREWQEFFTQREQRQIELWQAENDIIEALDMEQSRIPPSLRQRLDKDWQDFENEWGDNGMAFKTLTERQKAKVAQRCTTDAKTQKVFAEFSDNKSDMTESAYQYENLSGRHKEWAELQHDHKAIEDYYEAKGVEIPKATQNRMKRHIENYQEAHNLPYEPDESLNPKTEKEFDVYQNIHELYEADFAIAQSYGTVPDSTNDRLRQDLTEYFSMMEVRHALKQENSLANKVHTKYQELKTRFTQGKTKNERRDEFKQQMQPKQEQSESRDKGVDID